MTSARRGGRQGVIEKLIFADRTGGGGSIKADRMGSGGSVFPHGGKESDLSSRYLYFQWSFTSQLIWTAWFQSWVTILRPSQSGGLGCLVSGVLGLVLGSSV